MLGVFINYFFHYHKISRIYYVISYIPTDYYNVLVHVQTLASGVSQILGFSGCKALALNKFLMTAS